MRNWLKLALPLIALCMVAGISSLGQAMDVSGRASTVLEWFDNAQEDTAVPLYQYLNVNVGNIADQKWDFKIYGRLSGDLADKVDRDSELYFAYLEKKDLFKNLDLRLGRQFVATTAGASILDGLYLDYGFGKFDFALFGGGAAKLNDKYNSDDLLFGAEARGRFFDKLKLALSYYQEWDNGELGYELIGLDGELDLDVADLYTETQYSLITEETTHFLGGAQFYIGTPWTIRTEYLYSLPVFTSTSIYSVFATDKYQELMAEAAYRFNRALRGVLRLTEEMYETGDDATVVEAGAEMARTDRFSGYCLATLRNDPDGQGLYGVKAYGAYLFPKVLDKKVEAGLGAHIDVLERKIQLLADNSIEDDETTSSRIWVDSTVYLSPKINVQGKVEYLESDFWDNYYRGRVRLNILF